MARDIVHVLDTLARGGIETWLMHVLRASRTIRERSVLCVTTGLDRGPGTYREEIEHLGVPIHRVGRARGLRFTWALVRLLRGLQPTVVHAHMDFLSGWAVAAGRLAGVPQRFAHYHVTFPDRHDNFLHRNYIRGVRALEAVCATRVFGCSAAAIESYGSSASRPDGRNRVLYYGIDFSPFDGDVDRASVRAELGLPADALVIGHVGSFRVQKNHPFLLDVFAEVARSDPRTRLLLVGDGPARGEIERRIEALGLSDRVALAGVRDDVARVMLGAMDVFCFPSRNEGLGIVLLEAQAAGLPCVFSDVVPPEASVVPGLTHRLALDAGVARWSEALLGAAHDTSRPTRSQARELLRRSPFDLDTAVRELESIYP